jgi:UDP-N-acetylglucosamine:LPS N-acetylglucosamine transferase
MFAALDRQPDLHTTVICGHNKSLLRRLQGRYANIAALGFSDQVDQYMRQADLILSKPGGVTMFEIIHSELPIVIFPPFLEQEIANAAFLCREEMGLLLPREQGAAAQAIADLARDTARRRQMAENMRAFRQQLEEDALLRYVRKLRADGRWVA